ncbi:MAG: VCBS repeat-containing protein [Planctomycetes bacterium]|nr:VCBS repeat-containing protein [Planctomycetota bacterium]
MTRPGPPAHPIDRFVLAGLLASLLTASTQASEELHVEGEISSVLVRDLDADGLKEVLVSYHEEGQRHLGVFRGRSAYRSAPDERLPVDPQAILYAVGDFGPASGSEIVLFSRASAVLQPLATLAPGAERAGPPAGGPRRLLECDLFFTAASRTAFPAWLAGAPLDIDGDGAEDLVLPERRRLRILFGLGRGLGPGATSGEAAGAPWRAEASLPIGYHLLSDAREERIQLAIEDFAEVDKGPAPLLRSTGAYPFPAFLDFDGDRRLDVVVRRPGQILEVYRQAAAARFAPEPAWRAQLPWVKDATSLQLLDLNGDGRLDAVSSQLLLKDLATEVKVFLQDPARPDLGFAEPRQVLRVQGFFRRPDLGDADLDGRPDLLVSTYRVDLLDKLRASAVDEIEIAHEVFAGSAGAPFTRRPVFQRKFLLKTQDLDGASARSLIHAGRDLTGDGRPDLLFVDSRGLLRLYRSAAGSPVRYEEEPGFTERVEDPEAIELEDLDGRPGCEIILRYERRLEVHRPR